MGPGGRPPRRAWLRAACTRGPVAVALLAGCAYLLFVPIRPHTQPAVLGQPRCGSAAFPGTDAGPDGECDAVGAHRYAAGVLGAVALLFLVDAVVATVRVGPRRVGGT